MMMWADIIQCNNKHVYLHFDASHVGTVDKPFWKFQNVTVSLYMEEPAYTTDFLLSRADLLKFRDIIGLQFSLIPKSQKAHMTPYIKVFGLARFKFSPVSHWITNMYH